MITVGVCITVAILCGILRPLLALGQGALESYWFARTNKMSMNLAWRLFLYAMAWAGGAAILVGALWWAILSR